MSLVNSMNMINLSLDCLVGIHHIIWTPLLLCYMHFVDVEINTTVDIASNIIIHNNWLLFRQLIKKRLSVFYQMNLTIRYTMLRTIGFVLETNIFSKLQIDGCFDFSVCIYDKQLLSHRWIKWHFDCFIFFFSSIKINFYFFMDFELCNFMLAFALINLLNI